MRTGACTNGTFKGSTKLDGSDITTLSCCCFFFFFFEATYLHSKLKENSGLNAGGQTSLSCLYGDLNDSGQTSLFLRS